MKPSFQGGRNIAMKVPPHEYEPVVSFYRGTLGMKLLPELLPDAVFEFGANRLWIDRVPGMSQAELWLEIVTDDRSAAEGHFERSGTVRCDEIEKLPEGFSGFWVSSPASIIHLVHAVPHP